MEPTADTGVQATDMLHALLDGAGVVSMLAASLSPWSSAPRRREHSRRRKPSTAPAEAIPEHLDRGAALAAPWIGGWLNADAPRGNDKRIRL